MKSLDTILEQLESDLKTDLPALLSAKSLDNFELYSIGTSNDAERLGIYIYQDESHFEQENKAVAITFQMQLYQASYIQAAGYQQVLMDYLEEYPERNIGADILEKLEADTWPSEQTAGPFVYVSAIWSEFLDSCS